MEKFSERKGKIVDFCKENNINSKQLYRKRKKLNQLPAQTFYVIDNKHKPPVYIPLSIPIPAFFPLKTT